MTAAKAFTYYCVDPSKRLTLSAVNPNSGSPDGALAPVPKLKLLGDFYISVGLSGIEKEAEGDKRTPLGVYYITSNLNPASLPGGQNTSALAASCSPAKAAMLIP